MLEESEGEGEVGKVTALETISHKTELLPPWFLTSKPGLGGVVRAHLPCCSLAARALPFPRDLSGVGTSPSPLSPACKFSMRVRAGWCFVLDHSRVHKVEIIANTMEQQILNIHTILRLDSIK